MPRGRAWTPEEDALLAKMVAAGREYRSMGRTLKRSADACKSRAWFLGVKLDRSAILANRKRGRDRFNNNPRKATRRIERLMQSFTPMDREIRAEELRQRNRAGITGMKGKHHRPEVCARISAANKGKTMAPETRAKIAEARRKYWERWRANRPEAIAKQVMLADRKHLKAFGEWGEVQSTQVELRWCGQCELRVSAQQAAVCQSQFCKAKALAA